MNLRFAAGPLLALCLLPAAAAPSGPAAPLAVLPGAGTVRVKPDAARWQFAPRPLSDQTPLTHTFLLRSRAESTLTIERVAASCECIHAEISESASLPARIAPGQTAPVRVTLTLGRLAPGPVSKSIWIYLRGGSPEGLRLEMRGTIENEPPDSPPQHQVSRNTLYHIH